METVSVSVFDEPERKLCVSLELAYFFYLFIFTSVFLATKQPLVSFLLSIFKCVLYRYLSEFHHSVWLSRKCSMWSWCGYLIISVFQF